MIDEIKKKCLALQDAATRDRRYFHRHPELSFQEFETSRKIVETLREVGFDRVKIGTKGEETGVVADLQGSSDGPMVALRADIDALPVVEGNANAAWRSQNPGVMHACGHDGHTAALLCAARVLYSIKDRLPGRVRFIFQPAEELPERSGARAMIEDGVLDGVDAIFGAHVWAQYPVGVIGYTPGPITAASDRWALTIKGRGGHAAQPHLAHDPVAAACQTVTALQTIVSREMDPMDPVVLSACSITAGKAFNVIPEECRLVGTVRYFNRDLSDRMPAKIDRVAKGIAAAMQCEAGLDYQNGLPPTVNDPMLTELAAGVARKLGGEQRTVLSTPSLGAEDMSFYLEKVPGSYLLVGCQSPDWPDIRAHHHPDFDLDEQALPVMAALLAGCAWRYLEKGRD